jgi:phage gp36-like protein
MAYAAQSDLVPLRITAAEATQLTVDVPSGNPDTDAAVTAQIVSAALEEASGMVDSYCRQRYATPLQPSDDVKGKTLDIAVFLLFSRRRQTKISETVSLRYNAAIQFLQAVSAGKAVLDQPVTASPQVSTGGPQPSDRDCHLRFRDCNIEGFV